MRLSAKLGLVLLSVVAVVATAQDSPLDSLIDEARKLLTSSNPDVGAFLAAKLDGAKAAGDKESLANAATVAGLIWIGRQVEGTAPETLVDHSLTHFQNSNRPERLALALEMKSAMQRIRGDVDGAAANSSRASEIRRQLFEKLQVAEGRVGTKDPDTAERIGGIVQRPSLLAKTEPEYSPIARLAKHQGTVMVYGVIEIDGRLTNIRLVRSLGFGLDEKAYEALRQWRFSPATKNGEPVPVRANVEINFRLL